MDSSNAPRPIFVPWLGASRSAITQPWLGCRCSWPCTQMCYWNCISCGIHQYVAIVWQTITLAFEYFLLDGIVVVDFLAKVRSSVSQSSGRAVGRGRSGSQPPPPRSSTS